MYLAQHRLSKIIANRENKKVQDSLLAIFGRLSQEQRLLIKKQIKSYENKK